MYLHYMYGKKKQRKFKLNYRNTYKKFPVKNDFYIGKHDVYYYIT